MDTSDFSIQNVGADQLAKPGAIRLPLVSFVLAGQPGSDFGAAIEALRMQDYLRLEVIVVDCDATDADQPPVLDHQFADDPRFRRVRSPADLGPFPRTMLGLAAAEGEFVVFLAATDLPSPGFASAHIQAHLASRHNVAFTASPFLDEEAAPTGEREPAASDAAGTWLQPKAAVLRLASLDDDRFAHLASRTALVEPTTRDWATSPEAIQVYRRFVIDMLHPPDAATAPPASAPAHFAPLCQLLGGSAAIRVPLSRSLRTSATAPATSSAGAWSLAGDRHKLGVWAANGADFSRRVGYQRYWEAFATMLGFQPDAAAPSDAAIADLVAGNFPRLAAAFGEQQSIHHLHRLLSRRTILAVLRKHYGPRLPLRVHWAVRSAGLRKMHERIRLHLRARRNRRRQKGS